MGKKKNISLRKSINRFNYWEDWILYNVSENKEVFRIPIEDEDLVEEECRKIVVEIIDNKKLELIPNLFRLDYSYIKDHRISNLINSLQKKSITDDVSKRLLIEINKASLPESRGRTKIEETIKLVERDISEFDSMMTGILSGETVETVTDCYETNSKLIYDTYIKISKIMMDGLKYSSKDSSHWEFVLLLFGIMLDNIQTAEAAVYFEYKCSKFKVGRWALLKGAEAKLEVDKDYFKNMK